MKTQKMMKLKYKETKIKTRKPLSHYIYIKHSLLENKKAKTLNIKNKGSTMPFLVME